VPLKCVRGDGEKIGSGVTIFVSVLVVLAGVVVLSLVGGEVVGGEAVGGGVVGGGVVGGGVVDGLVVGGWVVGGGFVGGWVLGVVNTNGGFVELGSELVFGLGGSGVGEKNGFRVFPI
jgi:hypothetical protein